MKKRIVSIELLRMLAMMMVVMLHYLGKGNLLENITGEISLNGYIAWGLESLSIMAVNVYMLISGYFLVESGFKPARLAELICQVLFYTILVPVVLGCLGIIQLKDFTIYHILLNVLPVQMNQYWFITAYVIMYLFSPVLSAAAKAMKREQLKYTIFALLLFFSVSKTVLPVELAIDNKGNDCVWFLCVFLVAAYIRLYGIPFLAGTGADAEALQESGQYPKEPGIKVQQTKEAKVQRLQARGILSYLICCLGIFCLTFAVRAVYMKTGSLDHFIKIGFDYNHVLNLLGAIGLFYGFLHWKLPQEGLFARVILKAAPYSLGVYLLHEQLQIRNLWPHWLGASMEGNPVIFVARCILSVLLVYVIGTLADAGRAGLFKVCKKIFAGVFSKKSFRIGR